MPEEMIFIDTQNKQEERRSLEQAGADLTKMKAAPNLGQPPVPHILTFVGVSGGAGKTYLPSDEALQHSWANAQYMRQDAAIMEPLEVRKRAVALLDWHLEADDPDDPQQSRMVEEMTWVLGKIPRLTQYREVLLEAIFYGRYAIVNTCQWMFRKGKALVGINRWRPLHGDKLVWRWDDESGDYDPESVGIRIGRTSAMSDTLRRWETWAQANGGQILTTHFGVAFFPPPHLRDLIVVHRHMVEDGDWHNPNNAARIFGVGIRSRLYWTWYQKQEALAWLMEYLERSAFGLELWYYPAGSEQAKQATIEAATERIGNARNILVIPRPAGPEGQMFGVEVIERNMAGASALKDIVMEYFGHQIKRYILGQTLTTEAHATGLGSNLASVHLDTFLQIVKYDAQNLAETLTSELLAKLVKWNYPWMAENPLRLVIETEKPDALERLQAIQAAYQMGLKVRARDVWEVLGLAEPREHDEVLAINQGAERPAHRAPAGEDLLLNGAGEVPPDPFSGLINHPPLAGTD
jgi:phage gp29-like protein